MLIPEECHSSFISTWTLRYWPYSLSATFQAIPYLLSDPSIKSTSLRVRDKDIMWDSVKHCTLHKSRWMTSVILPSFTKTTEFVRYDLPLVKPSWLSPITLFAMPLSIVSRVICSMILTGTEVRRTGLHPSPGVPYFFLKWGLYFPILVSENFTGLYNFPNWMDSIADFCDNCFRCPRGGVRASCQALAAPLQPLPVSGNLPACRPNPLLYSAVGDMYFP